MSDTIETRAQQALDRWKEFWGDALQAVYLYGSAARGEYSSKTSDINLLLLVEKADYKRWPDAATLAKRLGKKGFALPLMLNRHYIESSADVFPMEFLDIQLFHKTLTGEDIFTDLQIDRNDLRLQAEREIRGKWVQLRQSTLERGNETIEMRNLLGMTVPTWVAVFQALLFLQEQEVPSSKSEVLKRGCAIADVDPAPFLEIQAMRREKKALNRMRAWELIRQLLNELDKLIAYVDNDDSFRLSS
ncbi:hypothetical protein GF324_06610 [bacterium]|nr:hypothetical protein [bacterium]